MNDFTPVSALLGGILIGLAASVFLLTHGKVAGISGIFGGLLARRTGDRAVRAAFVAGLVLAGLAAHLLFPGSVAPPPPSRSLAVLGLAGLLVGFGTRVGNGCTSGHGVCGLSRLAARSLVATLVFMVTGALAVALFGGVQ
jgi:uncharacterized membrane protein YedE/YeeE